MNRAPSVADQWRALLSVSGTCTWCHGTGSAAVAGVPVVCACRPFDVHPFADPCHPSDRQ